MARRRLQKGCLYLRRGKRRSVWVGQYREDELDQEGKVHRILRKVILGTTRELQTKTLAQRELGKRLERINSFSYRPGRTATFGQFVESWREDVLRLRKPSSVKAAESHLRMYPVPKLGKLKLEELTHKTIQQFVSVLAPRVSRHTLLNILGTLGGILKSAKAYGYTCGNFSRDDLVLPVVKITKRPRFFSAAEVGRILTAAKEEPYRTMFWVAALTGLRAGEVCGLPADSVDLDRKTIAVTQSAWYGQLQAPKIAFRGRYLHDLLLNPCWTGKRGRNRMIEMGRECPGAIWKYAKSDARNRRSGAIFPDGSAQCSGISFECAGSNELPDIERVALLNG